MLISHGGGSSSPTPRAFIDDTREGEEKTEVHPENGTVLKRNQSCGKKIGKSDDSYMKNVGSGIRDLARIGHA